MMKRQTLEDKRRYLHKMDSRYVDPNTHKQVIDSHLVALDIIDHVRERLLMAERAVYANTGPSPVLVEIRAALAMLG